MKAYPRSAQYKRPRKKQFPISADKFGFFGGRNISINGYHEGVLMDGRVYDNNVPFGVSRAAWENGYLVTSFPEYREMTIGGAVTAGVGDINVE